MTPDQLIERLLEPAVFTAAGVLIAKLFERWSRNRGRDIQDLAVFRQELLERERYLVQLLNEERRSYEIKLTTLQEQFQAMVNENDALKQMQIKLYHEIGELKLVIKKLQGDLDESNRTSI